MSAGQARGIEVSCSGCGASTTMVWQPGAACPECGSTDIQPTTRIQLHSPAAASRAAAKSGSRPNPLVAVLLVAVIVIALGFFIRSLLPKGPPTAYGYWACEACDIEFTANMQRTPLPCPDCGGEAYHLVKLYCSVHEHVFDVYLQRPDPESFARWQKEIERFRNLRDADPSMMPPIPYITSYKLAGSDEWTTTKPTGFCCPEGNCDMTTMKQHVPQ